MFRRNNPVTMRPEGSPELGGPQPHSMNELPLRPASAPIAAGNAPQSHPNAMPAPRTLTPQQPTAGKPEIPASRFGGIPGVLPRRVGGQAEQQYDQQGLRKLIVGREITLSGDITACDILVVEGNIEATLRDGKHLEITQDGHFKGMVEIDDADVSGKFEGTLTVRGRLKVRSTGQIEGTVSYGELEVEAGGKLIGEVKTLTGGTNRKQQSQQQQQPAAQQQAPQVAALVEA